MWYKKEVLSSGQYFLKVSSAKFRENLLRFSNYMGIDGLTGRMRQTNREFSMATLGMRTALESVLYNSFFARILSLPALK